MTPLRWWQKRKKKRKHKQTKSQASLPATSLKEEVTVPHPVDPSKIGPLLYSSRKIGKRFIVRGGPPTPKIGTYIPLTYA